MRRDEAAADDHDHTDTLGVLLGCEDIHGQGGSKLAAIDHVLLTVKGRISSPSDGGKVDQDYVPS